jgi:hypothetical protein
MRTTLSLDEDVAAKLKAESQRSGRPFRVVVNDFLRRGLAARTPRPPVRPFKVVARDLGAVRPGLALDSVADLVEALEGPLAR